MKQPPPDIDALFIFNWLAERIVYIACVLLIFFGAVFASIFSPSREDLPFHKQVFAMLFGVTIMGLIAGYCIQKFELNPYLMGILSAFMGMGADRVSHWALALWQKSEGFEDFVTRVGKIIFAVRKAIKDTDPDAANNHENHESTTN